MKKLAPLFLFVAMSSGLAPSAAAAGTIVIIVSNGWVTGSVTGMPDHWPYDSVSLAGSFPADSTAVITFNDTGTPTLSLDPLYAAGSRAVPLSSITVSFSASSSVPNVSIEPSSDSYVVPVLNLSDISGRLSVQATGTPIGLTTEVLTVPEPESFALMLAGLASLALWSRRRVSCAEAG